MQPVTVVAREVFPYNGITRYVGDVFDVTAEDARILTLVGRVDEQKDAVIVPASESAAESEPTKRRYRRRDLSAEGE